MVDTRLVGFRFTACIAACIALVVALGAAPALRAELVARLTLDGGLSDSSGKGNDGVFFGGDAPTFTEGFDGTAGGAVLFDGVDDYILLTPTAGLPITNAPAFTIAMWVNGDIQTDKRVFSEGSSTNNTPLFNLGTHNTGANGALNSFLRPGPGHRQSAFEAFDGTWHHIAWVDDGGKVDVYIDGVRDPANLSYERTARAVDRTTIGAILRGTPCCFFTGAIDDIAIYDHALTEEEVQALIPTPGCPAGGDTRCSGLVVESDGFGGVTATATGADDGGDDIIFTFTARGPDGVLEQIGPQAESTAEFQLGLGMWTIAVTVDDDLACFDRAGDAVCSQEIEITPAPQEIGRWKFDGDLADATGNGNDGVFVGADAPTFVEGFDGTADGAVLFDGVDDFVQVTQNLGLPLYSSEAYTVAMWVKGPAQKDKRVWSEGSSTDNNPLINVGTDNTGATGALDIFIRAGATLVDHAKSPREPFDGESWHHIAWVDDGGNGRMYVDGVAEPGAVIYTRPASVSLDTTTIGAILRGSPCCFFTGAIDDVRVFNFALGAGEIRDLIPALPGCPDDADTRCDMLEVAGPEDRTEGVYTATVTASDDSGDDPLSYLFIARDTEGREVQAGPQDSPVAELTLAPGMWTITATVDDALLCHDDAPEATCTREVEVLSEPEIKISGWPFDGDLLDSEPAANDAVFQGGDAPTYVPGYDCTTPGAIEFDGVDDLVVIQGAGGLPVTQRRAFTIAMWVRGSPQADKRVFSESNTQGNNATLFNLGTDNTGATGAFDFFYRGDDGGNTGHIKSTTMVFDGTWHHIAWVDVEGDVTFYVDGQPDATDFDYTRRVLTLDTTTIGGILRGTPCCLFTGSIDDVMIFNFALDQEAILSMVGDGPQESCCPDIGDTHCEGLDIAGPDGDIPGDYTVTASARDESGDAILYTFMADNGTDGPGNPTVIGPQAENTATFTLDTVGPWTISVTVDDDPDCPDTTDDATCAMEVTVNEPGGLQLPGDCNQDGKVDLSDAVCVFGVLFLGVPDSFPCGDGTPGDPASITLIDWQPDGVIDLSDGVAALQFLFSGGPPHTLGRDCVRIVGCPDACAP